MGTTGPNPRVPRFVVEEEAWASGFFKRMKSYLTERPPKLPRGAKAELFAEQRFGGGFVENFKLWLSGTPAVKGDPKSRLTVAWKPWYTTFWENLRDTVAPPKLPPLKLTSQPVKVRDIWSKNEQIRRTQALAFTAHALLVLLLVGPFAKEMIGTTEAAKKPQLEAIELSPYLAKLSAGNKPAGGGGGGGERMPEPPSRGKVPKFSMQTQISRPAAVVRNPNPALPVEPTLFGPPDLKLSSPNLPNYGDPLAALITGSSGPGSGGGIGSGSGGGIGSGEGGGLGPGSGGGTGGGVFNAGRDGVGEPACIYCPNPTFTDEAVKARYQGTVVLRVIVTADGRATNISVVRGAGLGLDERAAEAVRGWKFRAARGPNGQPVATWVNIEVVFRQL